MYGLRVSLGCLGVGVQCRGENRAPSSEIWGAVQGESFSLVVAGSSSQLPQEPGPGQPVRVKSSTLPCVGETKPGGSHLVVEAGGSPG